MLPFLHSNPTCLKQSSRRKSSMTSSSLRIDLTSHKAESVEFRTWEKLVYLLALEPPILALL